ncbi:RNA-binding domain-containing [Lecanosticta acicola]|uniref:RNA-binding domain-containing n=1 Tax=Lecanosticta acicola TaxID=111012 RepID=A0AAI8YWV3_9PEZI|nr:RNA-binding domain-containing [Lecanosticta acicola]
MAVLPPGHPQGKGYARVQRVDEAYKLYNYLTENIVDNRNLRVHLWDISNFPAVFVRCNCGNSQSHPPSESIARMAVGPGWQTFNAMSPMPIPQPSAYVNAAVAMPPPMSMPLPVQANEQQIIAAMQRLQLNPQNPNHRAQFAQVVNAHFAQESQPPPQARPPPPMSHTSPPPLPPQAYPLYITNTTGAPVNAAHGLIQTEARGIFISNLSFKSTEGEIEQYFSKPGKIVKIDLQKDANGKSKGNATIQYATAEAAQDAVRMYHRREFMKMVLKVRADRERTAINAPAQQAKGGAQQQKVGRRGEEPTIVNGSQAPRKDSAISGLPFKS